MTLMRIKVDGKYYPVLHYRFAIHQKNALIEEGEEGFFFATINRVKYVLGFLKKDGTREEVVQKINHKL